MLSALYATQYSSSAAVMSTSPTWATTVSPGMPAVVRNTSVTASRSTVIGSLLEVLPAALEEAPLPELPPSLPQAVREKARIRAARVRAPARFIDLIRAVPFCFIQFRSVPVRRAGYSLISYHICLPVSMEKGKTPHSEMRGGFSPLPPRSRPPPAVRPAGRPPPFSAGR